MKAMQGLLMTAITLSASSIWNTTVAWTKKEEWKRKKKGQHTIDLCSRTKTFALRIIRMYTALPKSTEAQVLGKQVLRSGTSVGANYREAYRERSRAEFIAKVGDCLKELEETNYWLELLVESSIVPEQLLKDLKGETDELIAIFVTIIKKARQKDIKMKKSTLGEVTDKTVKQSGPPSCSEFTYIDISSIDREKKCISETKIVQSDAAPSRAKQVLQSGDILISMTRPNLNAVAIVPPELHGAIGSTGFHVLRSKWVEPKFLFYLVQSRNFIDEMCRYVQGALYPAVRPKDIFSFEFFLPSYFTQRRIVAKLEELFSELDKGIENLKIARAQLKVYRQAVLKRAFEGKLTARWREENKEKLETPEQLLACIKQEREARYQQQLEEWETAVEAWEAKGKEGKKPGKPKALLPMTKIPDDLAKDLPILPAGWLWARFGHLSDISGGLTKNQKRNTLSRRMKYLRVANVYADKIILDEVYDIGATDEEIRKVALEPGDLLIIEGNGSIDQIGRVAVWNGEIPECGHQNHLIRARFLTKSDPRFFLWFMLSPLGRDLIIKKANSTFGLHTLSISKVSNLTVPVLTLKEETVVLSEIEEKLSIVDKLMEEINTQLIYADSLRQSILKKAFSGQLVPQDPNDEPASRLLERIRAEKVAQVAKQKPAKRTCRVTAHEYPRQH